MIRYLHFVLWVYSNHFSEHRNKSPVQVERNSLTSSSSHFDRFWLMNQKKVTSLAPPWQHPPSSTCQCQVTISQVPPSITWDIPNDYTLCANANACQEVPWYKAWVSCSMTNDVPNEGWTSMSVLKSRRDFNYSSVWLPAWPSVKTWTEVNYSDDVLSSYLAVYLLNGLSFEMADCQRSL